jgi:hypothetical protein
MGDIKHDQLHDDQIYVSIQEYNQQVRHDSKAASTIYTDAMGRYPVRSLTGNEYVMTSVYNGFVYLVPMKNRSKEQMIKVYTETYDYFEKHGHKPSFQHLDNESSKDLETYFKSKNIDFQFCDKDSHRRNLAERAIRDAKNHIVSMLATAHQDLPKGLWDTCIPQAIITLNLLRRWKLDPKISAYEGFYGSAYDFAAHPIAPFGAKILIYEKPEDRATWAEHGIPGYYLGPEPNTYRGYDVWAIGTRHHRITHTVEWFPTPYHQPVTDARCGRT